MNSAAGTASQSRNFQTKSQICSHEPKDGVRQARVLATGGLVFYVFALQVPVIDWYDHKNRVAS
jgi:hypothetical protein